MKVTINPKVTAAAFRGAERSPGQGKREVSQRSKVPGPLSPRMQAWEHVGILCPPRGEIKACLRQSAPSSGFRFTVGGTNPTTSLKRRPHQSVQGFVLLASTKTPPSWGDDRRYCIAPQRRNQSLLRCRGRRTIEVKTLGSAIARCAARGRRVAPLSVPVSPTVRTSLTGRLRALSEPILAERFEQRLALGAP